MTVLSLRSPLVGTVVAVKVAVGDVVAAGAEIVVIESMKMELHVKALFDGTLEEILCKVGDMVERHQILAIMEPNLH